MEVEKNINTWKWNRYPLLRESDRDREEKILISMEAVLQFKNQNLFMLSI